MKRFISIVLVICVLLSLTLVSVSAADYGCDVDTTSNAVYLENLNTGNIIYEKNADKTMYPASTTKIMSYIIVAENVSDFDNTNITIDETMFDGLDPESSVMGLAAHDGETFSVRELLYGMMVASGNDAAWVLANYVGDGVDNFVQMMNKKAAELGCSNTHFVNPHGLYDPDHYTTAKDLAIITKCALEKDSFVEITNTTSYTPKGFSEEIQTTNYLIDETQANGQYYYQYAIGIKTGYTDEAGKCLVSMADKDNYSYLQIELGSPYSQEEQINYAMIDAKNLYEWSFNNIEFATICKAGDEMLSLPVSYVWGDKKVKLVSNDDIKTLLPKNYDQSAVSVSFDCPTSVPAPIKAGDKIGTAIISYQGEEVGTAQLVANEDINRSIIKYAISKLADFVAENPVISILILLIIFAIILLIIVFINKKKKEKKRYRYR